MIAVCAQVNVVDVRTTDNYNYIQILFILGPSGGCVPSSNASDPIAYWSFDENQNNSVLTTVSRVSFVTGLVGQAIRLSSGSYVSSPFVNVSYRSFSIEMWFYPISLSFADAGLFGECQKSSTDLCLALILRQKKLLFAFGQDDTFGSTVLQANQWYHVACVHDCANHTKKIYLNGTEETVSQSPVTGPYKGQCGAFKIGNDANNSTFMGLIDQVSVWDRVRTASEILDDVTIS